jgi:WD40 repeat protein
MKRGHGWRRGGDPHWERADRDRELQPGRPACVRIKRNWQRLAWDSTGQQIAQPLAGNITASAWASDGQRLAVALSSGVLRVVDGRNGTVVREWQAHPPVISALSFGADGTRLASGGFEQLARVWHVDGGEVQLELRGHQAGISDVHFSQVGRRIVTPARTVRCVSGTRSAVPG